LELSRGEQRQEDVEGWPVLERLDRKKIVGEAGG
jgi:hypothetical protein